MVPTQSAHLYTQVYAGHPWFVIPAWMPETSHMDVKLSLGT